MKKIIIGDLEIATKAIKDRLDALKCVDQEIEINYDSEYDKFDITAKGKPCTNFKDDDDNNTVNINYIIPNRPKEDIPPQ